MGLTASALSHSLRQLEASLGVRLLNRSTRSVTPTDAGQRLLDELTPALGALDAAVQAARDASEAPHGVLRLNVPRQAARAVLAPVLPAFQARCPQVQLQVVTNDGLVDIVAEGFDAGIRFGESLAQDMVATPVGPPQRFVLVATPAYLAAQGKPKQPADLATHRCIGRRFPSGAVYAWEFAKRGRTVRVNLPTTLLLDDEFMETQACLASLGLAYLYAHSAAPHLASGALQAVLGDWMPPAEHFHLYHPSRRHVPAALRVLIELLKPASA